MVQETQPRQEIEVDPDRKLIVVKISGFFSQEIAHAATMETRRAVQSLGTAIGKHLTLYDMTDAAPASAETVELIRMVTQYEGYVTQHRLPSGTGSGTGHHGDPSGTGQSSGNGHLNGQLNGHADDPAVRELS